MREVDRRSKYNRRVFLQGAATAVPVVAAATSAGLGINNAWAEDATALSPATLKTLVKVARDIYPHDRLADSYYITAVKPLGRQGRRRTPPQGDDRDRRQPARSGRARAHKVPYADVGWEDDRVELLHGIEQTAFFTDDARRSGRLALQPEGGLAEVRLRGLLLREGRLHQARLQRHRLAPKA